jgi:hypothetical protein
MRRTDFDQQWRALSEEALTGITEWRLQHPRASLKAIEAALDDRLSKVRARRLQDAALASDQADWTAGPDGERPRCPNCEPPLRSAGSQTRQIQTQDGHALALSRTYGVCPECGAAFSPLAEELQRLPGRLSRWMPVAPAGQLLADFMHLPPIAESLARTGRVKRRARPACKSKPQPLRRWNGWAWKPMARGCRG